MSLEDWNRRYAAGEKLDDPAAPLVKRFAASLKPGSALDLACGPGGNALYLAERGWRVTAVDGSSIAIEHLRRCAALKQFSIDIQLADLERGEFQIPANSYDLVLDILYLQRDLIPAIQSAVRPGGLVIAAVLLANPDQQEGTATRAAPGELRSLFSGWNILHYFESGGESRSIAELVAAKPTLSENSDRP